MKDFYEFRHTEFGILTIEEVYQEYDDIPLLFSVYSAEGIKFLVTSLKNSVFLAVRFYESTRCGLFTKNLDIYTAFHRGGEKCWIFKLNENRITIECKEYKIGEIPNRFFPLSGAKLFGYENKYLNERVKSIRTEAVANQCDCFYYRVEKPTLTVPELCKISEFFNTSYKRISERAKLKHPVQNKKKLLPSEYNCDLQVLPKAGSIMLQFVALHNSNLMEDIEYNAIIGKIIDILDCKDSTLDAFYGIDYSLIDEVKKFTRLLSEMNCTSELGTATSDGSIYHEVFRSDDMQKRNSSLKIQTRSERSTVYRSGCFYAANLNTRHFNFVESGTAKVFAGRFAQGFKGISLSKDEKTIYEVEFEDNTILHPFIKDKIVTTDYRIMSVKRKDISLDELIN